MYVRARRIHPFYIWTARVPLMVTRVLLCFFSFGGAITVSTPCWLSLHLSLLLRSFPSPDTTLCNYPAKDSGSSLHTATAVSLLAASILIESQVLIVKGDSLWKHLRSSRHIVSLEGWGDGLKLRGRFFGIKDISVLGVFYLVWFWWSVVRACNF